MMGAGQKKTSFQKQNGFSLIEILVALVIVAISLGAMLLVSQTNVKHTIILKDTILAQNVAWNDAISKDGQKDFPYRVIRKETKTEDENVKLVEISIRGDGKTLSKISRLFYVK